MSYILPRTAKILSLMSKMRRGIIRQAGAAAGAWTPADITTAAWYDASDSDTITESGGAVSQWDDKSGNLRHVEQLTGSAQPSYADDTITFDGTGDYLWNSSPFMWDNGAADAFMVIKAPAQQVGTLLFEGSSTDNDTYYALVGKSNSSPYDDSRTFFRNDAAGTLLAQEYADAAYDDALKILSISDTGAQVGVRINGDTEEAYAYARSGTLTVNRFAFGAVLRASAATFGSMDLNECVITPSTLSTSDRQKVEGYLAWKWGLNWNLPSGHPYRYDGSLFGYASLWSPEDITTAAWYDASAKDTITESGGAVSQWDDLGSVGTRHLKQATGSEQPTTNSTTLGGLNTMRHDQDYMTVDTEVAGIKAAIFITQSLLGSGDSNVSPIFSETGTSDEFTFVARSGITTYDVSLDGVVSNTGNANVNGGSLVSGGNIDLSTGDTVKSDPYIWYTDYDNAVPFKHLARTNTGTEYKLAGEIAEIVFLSSVPSTADRQKLEGYLAWKWDGGVAGTLVGALPALHPYKSAAPTA